MRDKDTKIAEGDFGDDNPFVMIIKNANNNDVFANGGVESGSGSVVVATPQTQRILLEINFSRNL